MLPVFECDDTDKYKFLKTKLINVIDMYAYIEGQLLRIDDEEGLACTCVLFFKAKEYVLPLYINTCRPEDPA